MGLAARALEVIWGRRLQLPSPVLVRYPELAEARWRVGGLPPRVGGWLLGARTVAGVTLWRTIWLAPRTALDPALLLHEFRHVQQFEGSPAFPLRYLWESLTRGYRDNRYEADARQYAGRRLEGAEPSAITSLSDA